jgi:two-component system cell cycle sensor histidine kinase/response regulator CckA
MIRPGNVRGDAGGGGLAVLCVEHSSADVELCREELRRAGLQVRMDVAATPDQLHERLANANYDVILADYNLPGWTGLDALEILQKSGRTIPFILVTGSLGDVAAVEAIKRGVSDYILKDHLVRLPVAIRRAIQEARTKQEARRAEQLFHSFMRHSPVVAFIKDAGGRYLFVNEMWRRALGRAPEEVVGRTDEEIWPPEVAAQFTANDRAVLDENRPRELLEQVPSTPAAAARGERSPWLVFKFPIEDHGGGRLLGGVAMDLSDRIRGEEERRKLEQQLAAAQKFEAIGKLAGGIAHDFNNVLGAILGWAELALEEIERGQPANCPAPRGGQPEGCPTQPDHPLRQHLEKIRDQGERAADLTRQLLAFARRQHISPRNMDMNQTVRDALRLLESVLGGGIELRTDLAADLAVTRADPIQVEQVLMNLCINARDAMPRGGELLVKTRNAEFNEDSRRTHPHVRPGRFVLLEVTDTGEGMDAVTLDHIFEPFFTTKEQGRGTGLGLATVYGIVKQHEGFVHVYSEPGRGTTFRVYFPVGEGAPAPHRGAAGRGTLVRGGTECILVAEDHDGLRELARQTLERFGYRVLVAADGAAAVELFRRHREQVALALLDIVLPKLSGPDAYAQMTAEKPGLPLLLMTGYSTEAPMLSQILSEPARILQKPYTPESLARQVREVLDLAASATPPGGKA